MRGQKCDSKEVKPKSAFDEKDSDDYFHESKREEKS